MTEAGGPTDTTHPKHYEAIQLDTLPATDPPGGIQYFTGGAARSLPTAGLIVQVKPEQAGEWIGVFLIEYNSQAAKTELVLLDRSNYFCVVAGGRGYVVHAEKPVRTTAIDAYPIVSILASTDRMAVAFADFTGVSIVARDGHVWNSPQISFDGIRLVKMTADQIDGLAWHAPQDEEVPFTIDLRSRTVSGGAFPN